MYVSVSSATYLLEFPSYPLKCDEVSYKDSLIHSAFFWQQLGCTKLSWICSSFLAVRRPARHLGAGSQERFLLSAACVQYINETSSSVITPKSIITVDSQLVHQPETSRNIHKYANATWCPMWKGNQEEPVANLHITAKTHTHTTTVHPVTEASKWWRLDCRSQTVPVLLLCKREASPVGEVGLGGSAAKKRKLYKQHKKKMTIKCEDSNP